VLSTSSSPDIRAGPDPWWRASARVRAALRESVARLPPDRRALVPALVDGDDTALDPALADDFRTTGLTHLLAVSGTNLTLVVGFALVVARWCRVRGRWLYVVGAAGILGFVLLARAEPSVLRAAAMGSVALLGMGANGADRGMRALGVATIVLLLADPVLASAVGFGLSVLATAGILLLAPGWRDAMGRWMPRWLAEAIAVPAAAQLACTPLVAAIAGQVSLVAVAANLLAAPAVGPATVLGLLGGIVTLGWPAASSWRSVARACRPRRSLGGAGLSPWRP
jgi:competence protein ComEC